MLFIAPSGLYYICGQLLHLWLKHPLQHPSNSNDPPPQPEHLWPL